jgi:hypothetical protein
MYTAYQRDDPRQPFPEALAASVEAYTEKHDGCPPTLLLVNPQDAALVAPGCRTQIAAWIGRGTWGLTADPTRAPGEGL